MFVDLVPARTADDVLRTMADALGVEGDASRSSAELGAHLADRSMLIVLDNCEHVIDAVAELVDVALACGGTWRVLATSREPLGLGDEHLVPVEPLGAAAAELFVERARRLEPRLPWDASDERIIELCGRLDGLPLAVELAAGQVRRWSLAELRRRLDDPAHLLPARPRPQPTPAPDDERGHRLELCAARRARAASAPPPRRVPVRASNSTRRSRCSRCWTASRSTWCWRRSWTRASWCASSTRAPIGCSRPSGRSPSSGSTSAASATPPSSIIGDGPSRSATAASKLDRWMSGRLAARQRTDASHARQAFWSSVEAGHLDDAVELAVTRSFLWRNAVGCVEGHRWLDALASHDLDPGIACWVALLRADIAQGDGDFLTMIGAARGVGPAGRGSRPGGRGTGAAIPRTAALARRGQRRSGARRGAGDLT